LDPFAGARRFAKEVNRMARAGKRRRGGARATAKRWGRWQFYAVIARIVIEVLDRFGGGGPGHLP
jgi:hypothetical protein